MYPRDNIFNIYYNIGKRTPFLVKRTRDASREYRLSKQGRTFLVERVELKGKYGKAYGKCFVDGLPDDTYREGCYPDIQDEEIPCAGCGGWSLIEVPGIDLKEIFPLHSPDYIIGFGKYKGKTISEVYSTDPKYIFWLLDSDENFHVDFAALLKIDKESPDFDIKLQAELDRVFPKTKVDDIITFGKYKGKSYREVHSIDPNYIDWFLRSNVNIDVDYESFRTLLRTTHVERI